MPDVRARLFKGDLAGLVGHRRWAALLWLALGFVLLADLVLRNVRLPRVAEALADEPAHVLTALLLLAATRRSLVPSAVAATCLGAVLIDADHVPMELGWDVLTRGTNRPYSHSLAVAACLALVAWRLPGAWRYLGLHAVFGLLTHLVRDLATGGLPLYWPLAHDRIRLPYEAYAALLLAAAGLASWRTWRDGERRPPAAPP